MSANLDRKANGQAAVMVVGQSAWHREGWNPPVAPTTVAEVEEGAGLGWVADLKPVHLLDLDGTYLEIEGARAVVRSDTNRALGVVGSFYTPLQNRDMLTTLQPLVDMGLATWETAGSLNDGRDVWAMVRYNLDSKLVREVYKDELIPFGLIQNNHSGRTQVTLMDSVIREVCWNTHQAARRTLDSGQVRGTRIRHSQRVEANVVRAAQELWAGIVEHHEGLAREFLLLKRTHLDTAMFRQLVLDTALPLPEQGKASDLAAKLMKTRTEKVEAKREIVVRLWTEGLGHEGDQSAWEAYNALTQATDHEASGVWTMKGSRLQSLNAGTLADIKGAVYSKLLTFAESQNHLVSLAV